MVVRDEIKMIFCNIIHGAIPFISLIRELFSLVKLLPLCSYLITQLTLLTATDFPYLFAREAVHSITHRLFVLFT